MTKVSESIELFADKSRISIKDAEVRDSINVSLDAALKSCCITPYIGWVKASQILARHHIILPRCILAGSKGMVNFPANQFGSIIGMDDDGKVKSNQESDISIYFEWKATDFGGFDIFCSLNTSEELEDLMNDYNNDNETEDKEGTND